MKTIHNLRHTRTAATGLGLLSLMGTSLSLPLTASAKLPAASTASSSATLSVLSEGGENVYDAAKAGDWKTAAVKTNAVDRAARALPPHWKTMASQFRLSSSLGKLRSAVQTHQKSRAMHEANRVTLFAAQISRDTAPRIPVEVTLLDVYGRDLEVGAATRNTVQLATASRDLQNTWHKVRPSVLQHGGKTQARTFDGLMARVSKGSPIEYSIVATKVLDEVDNLESVFAK